MLIIIIIMIIIIVVVVISMFNNRTLYIALHDMRRVKRVGENRSVSHLMQPRTQNEVVSKFIPRNRSSV
jgi:hypothetical protein